MSRVLLSLIVLGAFTAVVATARGADPAAASLERPFAESVQPFLKNYCVSCHGQKKQEAKLDLSGYSSLAAIEKNHRVWETILERLEAEEMPPEKAPKHPAAEERRAVVEWIQSLNEDLRGGMPAIQGRCWETAEQCRVRLHDPRPDRRRSSGRRASFRSIRPTKPGSTTRANR